MEDPELLDGLLGAIRAHTKAAEGRDRTESRENAAAYGDDPDLAAGPYQLTDEAHLARSEAFRGVLGIIEAMSDKGEYGLSPAKAVDQIRRVVGRLARESFRSGLGQIPPSLQNDGVLGIYAEGIGTIVVWERVRGYEAVFDQIGDNQGDVT